MTSLPTALHPLWFCLPFLLAAVYPAQAGAPLPPLRVEDGRIVDDTSQPVVLRGVNLGNWLMLEMWMLAHSEEGVHDQYQLEQTLARRFGEEERQRLMEIYRENWITERDFEIVRSFDMNVVRLPINYELLESDDEPFTLRPNAWKWIDRAIEMAEAQGLYIILDMHGAPGRQSAMDHTGRSGYNRLWTDPEAQDRLHWLWREIAKRYKGRSSIAMFDLINEPWGGTHQQLREIIVSLYEEVRAVDPDRIIIFHGHYAGIDFYGDPAAEGWTNMVFSMHFYPGFFGWGRPTPHVHRDFLHGGLYGWKARMEQLNTPLFIGEFNVVSRRAGGAEMMRRYYDFYAEQGWPATMWSYKVLTRGGGNQDGSWGMVTNAEHLPEIRFSEASAEEIEAWFRSLSTLPIAVYEDLRYWLTADASPSPLDELPPLLTEAPHHDPLPDGWQATDIGNAQPGGGQQIVSSDEWHIYGGGANIWGTLDSFRFVWRKVDGPFELSANLLELMDTHDYAKAGLMLRDSLEPGSAHVMICAYPSGGIELAVRQERGGPTDTEYRAGLKLPGVRLKMARSGRRISLMYGDSMHEVELPFDSDTLYAGLAVLSHDDGLLTKAAFEEVTFQDRSGQDEMP